MEKTLPALLEVQANNADFFNLAKATLMDYVTIDGTSPATVSFKDDKPLPEKIKQEMRENKFIVFKDISSH